MATKTSAREIVIVCEEHIFQGSIRTKGKVDRSKISSLIDLLSNPVKTQPDDPTAQTGKDLLYISDALVYSIKSDSYEQMKGLYLPSENIIFAFEIKPDQFEGNPAFKLQAQMEHTTRQRLKIGIGEY
ncbi:MAG: hypothetical protein KAI75_06560, partial [Desulfobulbaceae bacterium]|nr:hypothetical protein [Desulfobulbaceae bacterium]